MRIMTPAPQLTYLCYLKLTEISPETVIIDYYGKRWKWSKHPI